MDLSGVVLSSLTLPTPMVNLSVVIAYIYMCVCVCVCVCVCYCSVCILFMLFKQILFLQFLKSHIMHTI